MKNIIRILVFSQFVIMSALVSATQLNVATSEWIPYIGKKLPNDGLAMDIVNTALKRAGYETIVTIQAWTRTLEGADLGVYDLIAAAWHSKEREKTFLFSKPYIYNEIKLVKHADSSFDYKTPADLDGRVVGTVKGYAYGDEFDNARGILRRPSIAILENLFRVLNAEVELTLDDERVLQYEIKNNITVNKDKLVILPKSISRKGLYIAVSRENPKHKEIVQAFDNAIATMKKDGSYARILKAHGF